MVTNKPGTPRVSGYMELGTILVCVYTETCVWLMSALEKKQLEYAKSIFDVTVDIFSEYLLFIARFC